MISSTKKPLPVTIFFGLCMTFLIWFFVIAGNSDSIGSWIYSVFLSILFFRMIHTRNLSSHRRVFLVVFAIFFAISFIGILLDERGSMSIGADTVLNAEIPFCHIAIPAVITPYAIFRTIIFPSRMDGHFASFVGMLLIWALASVTIGRGWCGWVCFYGGWEEGASRASKKTRVSVLSKQKDIRAFHFAFLFFIVLASLAFLSSVYCEWFCPFKLVTEFDAVTNIVSLLAAVMFIGLFLGLVLIMPFLTRKRMQCSSLCPFGSFQSLVGQIGGYTMVIDTEKCTGCMKCAHACQFCAIDRETIAEKKGRPEITCALCGECVAVCPSDAIRYEFRFAAKRNQNSRSCITSNSCDPSNSCTQGKPISGIRKGVHLFLDPEVLFAFTAFSLGMVLSSKFVPDAINRIIGAIAKGV